MQLAVRLGIHTGPVVVGDIGGGDRHEQLALGETPNIAARLQALAAPNTVVISPVTARLVRQTFVLEDLGAAALKGVAEPMPVWRVVGRRTPSRYDDEATPDRIPFLVGRDEELGLLRRRWKQSKEGSRAGGASQWRRWPWQILPGGGAPGPGRARGLCPA